jgi:hypothetical protein
VNEAVNPTNRQTRPAYRHDSPRLLYVSVCHPCKIRTESKFFVPEIYGILSVKTLAPTFSRPAKRIFLKNSFQSKQRFFTRFRKAQRSTALRTFASKVNSADTH